MTRMLAELLHTDEAHLKLRLAELERVHGHQNTDIKLSVEVIQATKAKIHTLGLDRQDTTSKELYHALIERVSQDDRRLERSLRTLAATHVSAEADLMDGLVKALQQETADVTVMAMKATVARKLLKRSPPKRLMKALKYRSLDAMLRKEQPMLIVAAAKHVESAAWSRSWHEAYKALRPADFEDRPLQIVHPSEAKWQQLATRITEEHEHTMLSLSEFGCIVLLPLPDERPAGMVVATLGLALQSVNSLTAAANYIRASQVQPDFGERLKAVASQQVYLEAPHMPGPLHWEAVQRYLAGAKQVLDQDILGPYVNADDFRWRDMESIIGKLCPAMEFWQYTAHLTFHGAGQAVSMNLLDAAIDCCNKATYEARSLFHAQQALWAELTIRYLNHQSVEHALAGLLRPELAYKSQYIGKGDQ